MMARKVQEDVRALDKGGGGGAQQMEAACETYNGGSSDPDGIMDTEERCDDCDDDQYV